MVTSLRDAIDEFSCLINDLAISEKVLHSFFLRHPEFLYRNEFHKLWYEPRLRVPDELTLDLLNQIVEPDFVLGSDAVNSPLGLVEVKLPTVGLLVEDATRLSAQVNSGLAQLRKYKRYFADGSTAEERRRVLGTDYSFPRCLLLIGSLPVDQRTAQQFGRIRETELLGVHLLTYDDVLNFQKERLARILR